MRRLAGVALSVALCVAAAHAESRSVIGANGMRYAMETNENGFVLRSAHPLVREVAPPGIMEEGTEIIYFGKDCDAFSPVLGEGTWWYANGGFVAELERHEIGFPRMEPGIIAPACRK